MHDDQQLAASLEQRRNQLLDAAFNQRKDALFYELLYSYDPAQDKIKLTSEIPIQFTGDTVFEEGPGPAAPLSPADIEFASNHPYGLFFEPEPLPPQPEEQEDDGLIFTAEDFDPPDYREDWNTSSNNWL